MSNDSNRSPSERKEMRGAAPWLLCLIFLLIGLVAILPSPTAAVSDPGWAQFRGNPVLTGMAAASLPSSLQLKWAFDFGEAIESSTAIVDGVVYAASFGGEVAALHLDDGSLIWKYVGEDPFGESSPAVAGGRVYIGDLAGVVHAIDAATGEGEWTFQTESEIKASPVVVGDRILIGSYDEHLYALSVRDGSVLWKFQAQGPVHSTAAVADGTAYISGCDEIFRAVRISDGAQAFEIPAGAYTGASPALSGDRAFFGTFNNEVLGVDLTSRSVAWRYAHPQRNFPFQSSAAVADGKVIVGGRDRMIHCLDAATGEARWTFMTRARVDSSPAVAGDRVYVGSNDGRLYVLDLQDGSKVWEFHAGAAISASPAIAQGRLVVGDLDGRLYCFGG
ncbi:MAG TPA: PQQ-binding-like beta-propeller repeat protein [Acidobacteriota bacterium]|nr:PQQ-binding-like beta-propeller repeat protein [Acidobacteriota bacterium]